MQTEPWAEKLDNTGERSVSSEIENSIFRRIFESAPDAIVVTDRDGRMVRVNKAADKLFGYNHEELLGQSVELIVPDRLPTL